MRSRPQNEPSPPVHGRVTVASSLTLSIRKPGITVAPSEPVFADSHIHFRQWPRLAGGLEGFYASCKSNILVDRARTLEPICSMRGVRP